MFADTLNITKGRKRREVCRAEMCWIFCISSVAKKASALNIAQVRKVAMQTDVKPVRRQRELGIIAGRLWDSSWRIQRMKLGISKRAIERRAMSKGRRAEREALVVIALFVPFQPGMYRGRKQAMG